MYLPPNSAAHEAISTSVVGTLIVYTDIPQIQDLPSRSQRFNMWVTQLHRDLSFSSLVAAPLGHSLALILTPTLHACYPQASISCPGKREQNKQSIGAHLFWLRRCMTATTGVCVKCSILPSLLRLFTAFSFNPCNSPFCPSWFPHCQGIFLIVGTPPHFQFPASVAGPFLYFFFILLSF